MQFRISFRTLAITVAFLLMASMSAIATPVVVANQSTPESVGPFSMPVDIHMGSCSHYESDAMLSLSDLTMPETTGQSDAVPAASSFSTIDISLDELLTEPRVIVVHESASAMNSVLVCGAIGGHPGERGLAVGLQPVSAGSTLSGVAWLTPSGAQTQIAVFLTEQPAHSATIEVPVVLGGDGNEFTIEAALTTFQTGQRYRFVVTNEGALPHEFVIGPPMHAHSSEDNAHGDENMHMNGENMHMDDGSTATSGDHEAVHNAALAVIPADALPPGATVSVDVVFHEPAATGDLEFACHVPGHYEADMFLPITVVN